MNIRHVTVADTENCGRVIYKAFCGIADKHNFPHDFPSLDAALQMAQMSIANPDIDGFVAEDDGQFLGSNFLWRQNRIAGVGPITVDPDAQARGVGRRLMQVVIERGKDASGIRLVQDAFNTTSMSLYASLGFDVVEPLVIMQGTPAGEASSQKAEVRPLEEKDFDACAELCRKAHGFDRDNELKLIIKMSPTFIAVRENRVVAYASAPTFWQMNHAVAETTEDMQSLLSGAARLTGQPLAFLLPTRQAKLFRWCLSQGLRVVKPMTLMAMGEYREPRGCFLPSVLY
ncbi:MAG: GNAT family N-acetyltransferase [Pyrinomonadaceae bacterium]|nr:GNAT family N-acetyltransferase [Pyrinomonadaceae bacterium]